MAGRHEEAVALGAAKTEVGGALGQRDASDHRSIGGEDGDAVELGAHPPAAPQIAVDIAAEAVGRSLAEVGEVAAVGQPGSVAGHIEYPDRALRLGPRLDDVEAGF